MGDLTNLTVGEEQFSIGQTFPTTALSGQIMRYGNGKWSPVTFGVVPSGNARAGLVLDNYGAPSNGNFNFGINGPGGVVGGTYLNQSFSLSGQNKIKELATAAPLTGLDTSQGGAVTASDSVLSAIGKLSSYTVWTSTTDNDYGVVFWRLKNGVLYLKSSNTSKTIAANTWVTLCTLPDSISLNGRIFAPCNADGGVSGCAVIEGQQRMLRVLFEREVLANTALFLNVAVPTD